MNAINQWAKVIKSLNKHQQEGGREWGVGQAMQIQWPFVSDIFEQKEENHSKKKKVTKTANFAVTQQLAISKRI